jgi:hypothetical protein
MPGCDVDGEDCLNYWRFHRLDAPFSSSASTVLPNRGEAVVCNRDGVAVSKRQEQR